MVAKSVYLLVFLLTTVAVVNAGDDDGHRMTVGARLPGDRLVSTERVIKDSQWARIIKLKKRFFAPPNERITMVRAIGQGTEATVSLIAGGPDSNDATLEFKSKRSDGINFVVEIYAK